MSAAKLTAADREEARFLYKHGMSVKAIAQHFGANAGTVRLEVDPDFRARKNEAMRHARRREGPIRVGHVADSGLGGVKREEFMARLAEIPPDTRDLTARTFGDPLPGRRAIDKIKST
jgi:Helix-turn-helix domain